MGQMFRGPVKRRFGVPILGVTLECEPGKVGKLSVGSPPQYPGFLLLNCFHGSHTQAPAEKFLKISYGV